MTDLFQTLIKTDLVNIYGLMEINLQGNLKIIKGTGKDS